MKYTTIEQSKRNFIAFQKSIIEIADSYGLVVEETFSQYFDEQQYTYKYLIISIDENSKIFIYMINTSDKSSFNIESFGLTYTINNNESKNYSFNIELFVKLVNVLSGKPITEELCNEFLDDPESGVLHTL